jgi:hypothetical protein
MSSAGTITTWLGTVPAEGDSEYAELVVALNAALGASKRLTTGVHRTESRESIREQIERSAPGSRPGAPVMR